MPSSAPPKLHLLESSRPEATQNVPVHACLDTLEQAEAAWMRGLDQEAEGSLIAARSGAMRAGDMAMVARVEVAMAHFAIAIDEDERAAHHLASADPLLPTKDAVWQARAWLAHSALQRRADGSLGVFSSRPDRTLPDPEHLAREEQTRAIASLVYGELSAWARMRGDVQSAKRHAQRALETAPVEGHHRARASIEMAEAQLAMGDIDGARLSYLAAIEEYRAHGYQREEGRTAARYALRIAPNAPPGADEPPASWLGRAKVLIGSSATWRDVASSRGGFRTHGRRMQDRAVGGSVAMRIDALDEATSRMRACVAGAIDDADRALGMVEREVAESGPELQSGLAEVRTALFRVLDESTERDRSVRNAASDVVDVIEMTTVERDRMRALLDLLPQVDSQADSSRLGYMAAAAGAELLQADHVLLVRRDEHGALEVIGSFGDEGAPIASSWRSAVQAHLDGPTSARRSESPATRSDERPRGPVLVAGLRATGIVGALYADKLSRSGRFNEQDHQLAELFADYFSLAYSRLAAVDAKRQAYEQLTTTLDTIRDGVIAIDGEGVVRHLNATAARMLRMSARQLVGRRISDEPTLDALWALLKASKRVDGSMVRLAHGSLIVSARPVASAGDEKGLVATLVELDRARRLAHRVTATRPRYVFDNILGESEKIKEAIHLARQAAAVQAGVLITGESGTGKEVFAQAIHTAGARSSEPFVGVNCAAVPRELLEAELFGYERGAFTGARSEGNLGKFELAGEGTLLLDEIGDMPMDMQAKLLRVLQERVVVRLGGSAERSVRARVIATTNRDLQALVEAGRFRHDLFYRLQVLHIHLQPLRERGQDVLLLANDFLKRVAKLQHKTVRTVSVAVQAALEGHSWPGNVRELANVIEREVSLLPADAKVLERLQTPLNAPTLSSGGVEQEQAILPLAEVERRAFLRALELCGGNIQQAAQALGVSKVTFYAKLRAWGLHPRDRRRLANGPASVR